MALNDMAIRTAKPGLTERKLADERGLYLLVGPNGSKLWRLKFRVNGKEKKLALGAYPAVSLKEARQKRDDARRMLEAGGDPAHAKQAARVAAKIAAANTFESVAEEYLTKLEAEGRADVTIGKARWLLAQLNATLATRPVSQVTPQELLAVLKTVERAGKRETARRLRSFASRVFRYAVATARASSDPAQLLQGALVAPVVRHHPAIVDPAGVGALLRAIDGYGGQPTTIAALKLSAHLFQRPGEIRQMRWEEIDFDRAVWNLPSGSMKQRKPHAVPLSSQALAILNDLRGITGHSEFVFPGLGNRQRPLCENTICTALRRLGFNAEQMTAHGFRTTASSLLNESGKWNPDAIERALSHGDRDTIRGTYNRSAYWPERVDMAQWWSDKLDTLRAGATIHLLPLSLSRSRA